MRAFSTFALAAAPLAALAGPVRFTRRDNANNILVLQFASVLEQLESEFYTQGIAKFSDSDFQDAGFSSVQVVTEQLTTIQGDEEAHLSFLTKGLVALGSSAPSNCQFNFDSVLTDVSTMAATARVVENVGVAAYLGAAHLITDPQILTAAASILTIEARHQTILNTMSGVGTPIPQAFDIALNPNEVLAIAGGFISGCDLGVPANLPLTITTQGTPSIGTQLSFSWTGMPSDISGFNCQMLVGGQVNTISLPLSQCIVPEGINGAVALFITNDTQPLANNVVLRADANNIVAGPTMAFIDSNPSPLSQIVRTGVSSGASSTSTTVTESQASSIAASSDTSVSAGPNLSQGTVEGGSIEVNGWTNLNSDGSISS
ncbi:hypothetical protein M422DRAFT_37980 [Sphaerobolus stellatus SS14]|uniref:Ferritin-like domain-containing protein n=1 Tax=Sphaerobolus stellatus (strain SS14) TaxID=990650 RepID=A0A0C9TYQ9_SPHS4|nr:hypothetical protein M422DRAFT_37980 [Sphaerobolus stellatus SS14]